MKILGSGKVDDFKKVAFSDRVLSNMDVKPGDSVIFYKKAGESGVSMFRAEGSNLTSECDAPARLHLREAPAKMRMFLIGGIALTVVALAMIGLSAKDMPIYFMIGAALCGVLAIAAMAMAVVITKKIDNPADGQALVTVGGL
ncbi:MAG: hypothetical protein MJZ21_02945, partial [archaeon]|nr:hypothetical protein [archaeon]